MYCQLLLDVNRYKLAEMLAAKQKVRLTAMLREFVYAALAELEPEQYEFAALADDETWKETVRKRVEGRMRSKQGKAESQKDA
jgi:hypothetical protein